jgi:hypothetical protein
MNKITITLLLLIGTKSYSMELAECEKVFLGDKKVRNLIKEESAKETIFSEYLDQLKKIRNCNDLLEMALLKENGMVKSRNPVSAQILNTFVNFHQQWVMPEDQEYSPACQDKYQWEVYDKKTPSYHMTRALFQEGRQAKLILTGYGDLRSVRAGENPKVAMGLSITADQYKEFLGTEDKFQLASDKAILGFLYKRKLSSTNFKVPRSPRALVKEENWPKESLNIYKHFGGGLLGSPSFLYHYGEKRAYYRSNGRQILPRKYASAIWNNLLCMEPRTVTLPSPEDPKTSWKHPITQETNCLSCHKPLDQMAAGFRHITFIPTRKECSTTSPQIYIPFSFKAKATKRIWDKTSSSQNETSNQQDPFHLSYPVSFHKEKRLVGLTQLGKSLAEDINFYKCQVKKYHQFLYRQIPSDSYIDSLAQEYKEHQNGLKLIKQIMAKRSKAL